MAIKFGRPVETLNFPASHGGPTVGQAYRKRKLHKLYADPNNHINILLKKLADVDRSNPGILKLTMGTLGVPDSRFLVRALLPTHLVVYYVALLLWLLAAAHEKKQLLLCHIAVLEWVSLHAAPLLRNAQRSVFLYCSAGRLNIVVLGVW